MQRLLEQAVSHDADLEQRMGDAIDSFLEQLGRGAPAATSVDAAVRRYGSGDERGDRMLTECLWLVAAITEDRSVVQTELHSRVSAR